MTYNTTTTDNTSPMIYVACLASYSAGRLHGAWINVTNVDDMHAEIAGMLAASPIPGAEEWAIHDTDAFGECSQFVTDLTTAEVFASMINDGIDADALAGFIDNDESLLRYVDDLPAAYESAYIGTFESTAEYAETYYCDTCGDPPDLITRCIDWQGVWDQRLRHDLFAVDVPEGIALFRGDY